MLSSREFPAVAKKINQEKYLGNPFGKTKPIFDTSEMEDKNHFFSPKKAFY